MNNLRNFNPKSFSTNTSDLKLQIVDWKTYNESPEIDDGDDEKTKYLDNAKYIIQIFGVDEDNESVSIKVNGFKPRFFVNIPKHWEQHHIDIFISHIKGKVKKRYKDSIHDCKVLMRHKFRGFTNYEEFKFLKLTFHNTYAMNQYVYILKKKQLIIALNKTKQKYDLYESNIDAFIRFIHIQNINPAGWVQVQNKKYKVASPKKTYCQKEIEISWKDVKHYDRNDIAPLLVASFDIECDSSHGDFPLAKKGYKKLSNEIIDNIQKKWKLYEKDKQFNEIFENEENKKKFFYRLLDMAFSPKENNEDISLLYTKGEIKYKTKELLEVIDNIVYIVFYKICKVSDNKQLKAAVEESKNIWGNQSLQVLEAIAYDMAKKHEVSKDKIMLRIVKRDILVDKLTGIFNNFLPSLEGDKIIQIGTTIHRYGEEECFMKHIVTLNTCNPIDGAVVVACEKEEDVLKEWFNFIRILDPDIITGYNIFGFDFSFIYNRIQELGIIRQLGTLGRMKDMELVLEEKNLSSSALGENILTFLNMEGRVCMDLLKIIQKDHKLSSYKLDTVAETFINGPIKEIDGNKLVISGIKDLNLGNYIVIFSKKDKYRDGKKFKILEIDGDTIKLNEDIEDIISTKPSWRLAKDDVGPKDIFRLQKGNAEDRKTVAIYCIQDCSLGNKLINKLSIVSNNIGMANVCFVPLSYIFLRGQGVKIFSLVAKECREQGFLMPVLKKPKTQEEKDKPKPKYNFGFDDDSEDEEEEEAGYEGAIVLEPKPAIYVDQFIVVLDYSSLYPGCIISENYCISTYVMEEKYNNLEGYEYKDITHDVYEWINPNIKSKGKKKVGIKTCRFVQFPDNRKGIIPQILQKLLKERKNTRNKIIYKTVKYTDVEGGEKEVSGLYNEKDDIVIVKNESDIVDFPHKNIITINDTYSEFEKEVKDGLQLAYKITANSLYGQIGAATSPIYLKDIAASTTATGRNLLYLAKEKTIEHFEGAEVVYGDSVLPDTPLMLRNKINNEITFKQIDDINQNWCDYHEFKPFDSNRREKEQSNVENYQIFTSGGWSDINRIIRHKTLKKIYRIVTHTGMADVTEDHSLLNEEGTIIKPTEVKIGDRLLHNYPKFNKNPKKLENIMENIENVCKQNLEFKKAFIYGFFYGDGSCGKYNYKKNFKYTWALNNKDLNLCLILKELCEEIYDKKFKILDTVKSSGVYKIVPNHNCIKKYVNEYRDLFYNKDKYKIVPSKILNGGGELKEWFISGYYCADGYKCTNQKSKNIVLTNKGKIGTSMLYYIMTSLGYKVSINTRKDKLDIYKLICSQGFKKSFDTIKKIEYIGTRDDFVYDIETKQGNFNTGFQLIVKNTDSIFINFNPKDIAGKLLKGKEGLKKSIEMGVQAEKYIQQFLLPPHKLEYEKTFWPFILFTKKRYIGNKYEFDLDKYKQTSMGIVLKRRDNAEIVKHIYGGIINIIMENHDIPKSINFLKTELTKLVEGKFPLDMLTITKSLKSYYKNPESIAHKVLADRIGEREPGNKPLPSDRIPYVFIEKKEIKGVKMLQGEKIEVPTYIKEHNLKPDYLTYITNQILKPVCQIYALIAEDLEGYKYHESYFKDMFKRIEKEHGKEKAVEKVTKKKNELVADILFKEVIRIGTNKKNNVKEITNWFKPN
uniref:DNA polymerase n=1 Tax=viral metagenome TaxID=1070528 RepID=A0A6C0J9A7_9ZZZZ